MSDIDKRLEYIADAAKRAETGYTLTEERLAAALLRARAALRDVSYRDIYVARAALADPELEESLLGARAP